MNDLTWCPSVVAARIVTCIMALSQFAWPNMVVEIGFCLCGLVELENCELDAASTVAQMQTYLSIY